MRKRALLIVLCLMAIASAYAETIVLRTGARVRGTVVFQNDEVIILRDAETGARFQYPREDVAEVLTDEQAVVEAEETVVAEENEIRTSKKASILLELAGGAAVNPGNGIGGAAGVDLLVGSHHINSRHIFVGGGLGYHGLFIGGEKYNFLPVQVAVRAPFTEGKHAPCLGVSLGYGIALSKQYVGGIYAGLDLGYRCQVNPKTAIAVVAYTQFHQATLTVTEDIEGVPFSHKTGRNLVTPGVKIALYF